MYRNPNISAFDHRKQKYNVEKTFTLNVVNYIQTTMTT